MLSIILYGRNDNYGYNLHKRAALSFNCIAELLDGPDDEILFVDYNTSDDLPTFTEAIQDTLTLRARRYLRTLRVRPQTHRRFQQHTHLVALEPVARNIALRRSNPANRWILSTNTDMIFVPRGNASFANALSNLSEGLYHLPRFEIPETLWETFDRMNPKEVILHVGAWGIEGRLNEIVYGSGAILFDGPGDFQLIPRQTLFDINGFDERMLLGWHVDSNMAKRLSLKLGLPRSFLEHLFGYHCDHTRMATPAHRRDRIENDPRRFVYGIERPDIPEQAETWGCPDDQIDEVRLPMGPTAYATTLRQIVKPLTLPWTSAYYTQESYDNLWYDVGHILPFLLDLFVSAPRNWNIGWIGCRPATLSKFALAWKDLRFTGRILVSETNLSLKDVVAPVITFAPDPELLHRSNAFVFEAGLVEHDSLSMASNDQSAGVDDAGLERLQIVRKAFLNFVEAERVCMRNRDHTPRSFVFVNAIHNRFEELVTKHLGITMTPYSTRIRHGYVYSEPAGTTTQMSRSETQMLVDLVTALASAAPEERERALARASLAAEPLLKMLSRADASATFGLSAERISSLKDEIGRNRASARLELSTPFTCVANPGSPRERGLSRPAEYFDWTDPEWTRQVETIVDSARIRDSFNRSAWLWERVQTLYGLKRLGLDSQRKALVVVTIPDRIIGPLGDMFDSIDLLPLTSGVTHSVGGWADRWYVDPTHVRLLQYRSMEELPAESYDAVIMPHSAICLHGSIGFLQCLMQANRILRVGGWLTFAAETLLSDAEGLGSRHWIVPTETTFWDDVREICGLELDRPFDGNLSQASIDRCWESAQPSEGTNYFVSRNRAKEFMISSTLFLRKVGLKSPSMKELFALRGHASIIGERRSLARFATHVLHPPAQQHGVSRAAFFAEQLLPLLESKNFLATARLTETDAKAVREEIERARLSTNFPLRKDLRVAEHSLDPADRSLSRLAEYYDWDNPEWFEWLNLFSDSRHPQGPFSRTEWLWERAHILYGLARLGLTAKNTKGLVAVVHPDPLVGVVNEHVGALDLLPLAGSSVDDWADGWNFDGKQISVLPQTDLGQIEPQAYDFIIFPHSSICYRGSDGFAPYLRQAQRLLRDGGWLVFSAEIAIGATTEALGGWYPPLQGRFWSYVHSEFQLALDPFDNTVSRATLDRTVFGRREEAEGTFFNRMIASGEVLARAVWFAQKRVSASTESNGEVPGSLPIEELFPQNLGLLSAAVVSSREWPGLRFMREMTPDRLDEMTIHPRATRMEGHVRIPSGTGGHIAYGPYERLQPGRYTVSVAISEVDLPGELEVVVDVVANDREFAARHLRPNAATGMLNLDFQVAHEDLNAKFEYRIWTNGSGSFVLDKVAVERIGD